MTNWAFKREELFELVWSEPMKTLAKRYGISDIALSKNCRKHGIPVPPRGYWAKLQAGKRVAKQPLPPRGIGMPEIIRSGGNNHWARHSISQDLIDMEIPPQPEFPEPLEDLRDRVHKQVGKVTIPRDFSKAHKLIAKLLDTDDERRQKELTSRYVSSFDRPFFVSPFERRRLKLVNAIFVALERNGMRCTLRGKNPKDFDVRVGDELVTFVLDHPKEERNGYWATSDINRPASDKLQLHISPHRTLEDIQTLWKDKAQNTLEKQVTEIVVSIIAAGEVQYRRNELSHHSWLIERKAALIKEAKERKEEQRRHEQEQRRRAEQARVDRLLGEAVAFRKANDIRNYVNSVRKVNGASKNSVSEEEIESWASWALAQADRIDPVLSRSFLAPMADGEA